MEFNSEQEAQDNNRVYLVGEVTSEPTFSHESFGEGFFEIQLRVNRLSEMTDTIPITISEHLLRENNIAVGSRIAIRGQFRSYNKLVGDKSKLMLTVFVRDVVHDQDWANPNVIELVGFVCKPPIYRTTPFNREIADLLFAVNRAFGKSDYIPAIAWGRNARFAKTMTVGEKIHLTGRIQSREYQKRLPDDTVETRTAYELSINKLSRDALEMQFTDSNAAFISQSSEYIEA